MSDMLQDGAQISTPFSVDEIASRLGSQFTAREALAIELIRELALHRYRDQLIGEVKEMLSTLTDSGIQILLATAMRFPDYSLLELYKDVIYLQTGKKDQGENNEI